MTLQFTVSPDFGPELLPSWYVVNTLLQHATGQAIHLETYQSFAEQHEVLESGQIDLIYANPADTASLVRDHGFVPVARPSNRPDEALIAVPAASPYQAAEDLPASLRVATTDDPDVTMICMIMIEPADLDASTVTTIQRENYVLVAKSLLDGNVDAGFFLTDAYEGLSGLVRQGLRPLVSSAIDVIHHAFLVGPRLAERRDEMTRLLLELDQSPKGQLAFSELGISPLVAMPAEEAEFMIDLMDTLLV